MGKVKISQEAFDGILKVRDEGKTNMFDYNAVMHYANENEDYEAVKWMMFNKKNYAKIIIGDFEIDG